MEIYSLTLFISDAGKNVESAFQVLQESKGFDYLDLLVLLLPLFLIKPLVIII